MNNRINTYISDLLCLHDCVVIPNFGGFVANYQASVIDNGTNTIKPPSKSIVFNKSLSNNDGLLANEIAVNEKLSFKQAQKKIVEYVAYLNDSLHLHKKIYITEVGTLLLLDGSKIIFVPSTSRNHLLESYGYSPIQYPTISRDNISEKVKTKIIELPISDKKGKPSWLKVAAVALPLAILSFAGVSNSKKIKSSYASLIPLNTSTEVVQTKATTQASEYHINSLSNGIDQAVSDYYSLLNQPVEIVSAHKHFVIAGSFKSKANANKLVKKLNRWNYADAQVLEVSSNGYYRVCYTKHIEHQPALTSLRKIKKSNTSAWLLSN
ncbi:SPOR domain-containing protein [Flavobacteriales bacterium]|nr:SPOR domain-containing protein [Flavobacteriales bacterium]